MLIPTYLQIYIHTSIHTFSVDINTHKRDKQFNSKGHEEYQVVTMKKIFLHELERIFTQ